MSGSWARMDLSPLASRDFRVLFGSGTVTLLGTEATTTWFSLISGGALCVGAVGPVGLALPAFTRYLAPVTPTGTTQGDHISSLHHSEY